MPTPQPPAGISLLAAGELTRNRRRGARAQVADLVLRGALRFSDVREGRPRRGIRITRGDADVIAALPVDERGALESLLSGGDERVLRSGWHRPLVSQLADANLAARRRLVERGLAVELGRAGRVLAFGTTGVEPMASGAPIVEALREIERYLHRPEVPATLDDTALLPWALLFERESDFPTELVRRIMLLEREQGAGFLAGADNARFVQDLVDLV